jgi:hypothetical protein
MAVTSLFSPDGAASHVARARGEQIERITSSIYSGRDVVLVGARGIGKTSVLRAVEQAMTERGYRSVAVALHEERDAAAIRRRLAPALTDAGADLLVTVDDLDETTAPLAEAAVHELMAFAPQAGVVLAGRDAGCARSIAKLRTGRRAPPATVIELAPLERAELCAALVQAFADVGRAPDEVVDRLVDLTQGYPLATMLLARRLWKQTSTGQGPEQAWAEVSRQLADELRGPFEAIWESHAGVADRQVVRALAGGQRSLFSAQTLRDYGLSKSSASRARDRLIRQGHVHRALDGSVALADPLYAHWVAQYQLATTTDDGDAAQEREMLADRFHVAAPLGTPDGARSDITETLTDFVPIRFAHGNAAGFDNADSLRARVIVGRKGAGKTLYIRRFQASAAARDDIYADAITTTMPATSDVVRVGQWYAPHERGDMWQLAWRSAILRATASHLLTARLLTPYLPSSDRRRLELTYAELGGRTTVPRSIGAELKDMMAERSRTHFHGYLRDHRWDDLWYQLAEALPGMPPMAFYLDSIDEEYAHAPDHWLACQRGLFHAVMRLLRDPHVGGRLHVVVTIRDSVYASILATEHATRYRADPHIQVLAWDEHRIREFLGTKLDRLAAQFMTRRMASDPVEAWLGAHPSLAAEADGDLTSYLLRHTRLLPRDVIVLGNTLCDCVSNAHRAGRQIESDEVRASVADAARWFGREQLAIAANQLTAELLPPKAFDRGFGELYTGEDASGAAYRSSVEQILGDALRPLVGRTLDRAEVSALEEEVIGRLGQIAQVLAVLWQNGLLGYRRDGGDVFQHTDDAEEHELPERREGYVVHQIVAAALA